MGFSSHSQATADKKRPAVGDMELIDVSRNLRSRVIEPSSSSSSAEVSSPLVEPSWALEYFSSPLAQAVPELRETNVQLLRQPMIDLASMNYGLETDQLLSTLYFLSSVDACRGIVNLGNTCFASAVLQVVLAIEPLKKLLDAHKQGCVRDAEACAMCCLSVQANALRQGGPPETRCLVAIAARRGDFGNAFKAGAGNRRSKSSLGGGPQCDAYEFLYSLLSVVRAQEPHAHLDLYLDFETEFGKRGVLYDSIIGSLVRNRTQCVDCGATADALMREPFIELELHGNQLVALRELWSFSLSQDTPQDCRCPVDNIDVCGGRAVRNRFVEGEPPVLVLLVKRGLEDEHGHIIKIDRAIDLPERITFLRTGVYVLSGIVFHIGGTTMSGHYKAVRRLDGGQYCLFNDSSFHIYSASQVLSMADVRRGCYLLIYTRESSWSQAVRTGIERVPYIRGPVSNQILASQGIPAQPTSAPDILLGDEVSVAPSAASASARAWRRDAEAGRMDDAEAVCSVPDACGADTGRAGDIYSTEPAEIRAEAASSGSAPTAAPPPVPSLVDETLNPWRRFTPERIDRAKYIARTWSSGRGGQCSLKPTHGSDLCTKCQNGLLPHGKVTGEIPSRKMQDFMKAAERAGRGKYKSSS